MLNTYSRIPVAQPQTVYDTKGTRAHTHRELIRKWLWEPKGSSLEYVQMLGGESTPIIRIMYSVFVNPVYGSADMLISQITPLAPFFGSLTYAALTIQVIRRIQNKTKTGVSEKPLVNS